MKILILIIAAGLTFVSCDSETDRLKKRIWNTHDEVMPKMNELRLLQEQYTALPDSLYDLDDSLMIVKTDLFTADHWMMKWMQEFDVKNEQESYLQEQVEKVTEMSNYFEKSIKNGKAYITTINTK